MWVLPLSTAAGMACTATQPKHPGHAQAQVQQTAAPTAEPTEVHNVILIIGDGMDGHQITAARNYLEGVRGRLTLDGLPVRASVQVLTVAEDDPARAVYVADSANSGTAIATGQVTSRGRIATTAGTDEDITTIIELARVAGLRTGIVTTASVTDATPATFFAHINIRFCENPDEMLGDPSKGKAGRACAQDLKSNGGPGSIAEQLTISGMDVALGGGAKHFAPKMEGGALSVREEAERLGYHVVTSPETLAGAPRSGKLLGIFAPSTMPVRMRGEGGRKAEKPSALAGLPAPMKCEPNPEFVGMPSLKSMSEAALQRLAADNERGFFLMIESASIDKQAHGRKPCGSIGELQQLDEAVDSALAFADGHPGTLVIVTSDHGQAAQIVPDRSLFASYGVPVFTPGYLVRIQTPEGGTMAINYATNDFALEEHTGVNVPLFSNEQGRSVLPPMLTQPELFSVMRAYLGVPRQIASARPGPIHLSAERKPAPRP